MYVNVQNPMSQKTAFHLLQVCLYFDSEVMLGCSFLPCPEALQKALLFTRPVRVLQHVNRWNDFYVLL